MSNNNKHLYRVPIYGINTYISLISLDAAFYIDTFRDIYEAFVIYAFFNLLLNKLGGERALIVMLHSRPPSKNFFPGTLYSQEIFVGDPYTFLFVKRGILQFVYVKPILAVITMILKITNHYQEGDFSWTSIYLYITFAYNLSIWFCLWCLMVFFYATKKDLANFRPLPKFLSVKAVIFFSFWQGVVIALLVSANIIPKAEHISVAIQDFLVCIEMVPFAIAHAFSFSYEDYFDRSVHSARMPIRVAIGDSVGLKDVYMDTLLTFRGSGFSYRSFEPSEGVPHMGSSRTSRIMAGLRYSNKTSRKHWLKPTPPSKYLPSGPGEAVSEEDKEPLAFDVPDQDIEYMFEASRRIEFGDYNYPVIDFREPAWRQANPSLYYGSTSFSDQPRLGPREGCIDLVIEQGKGNYVRVEDLVRQQKQKTKQKKQSPVLTRPPPPAVRNHTLSKVKKDKTISDAVKKPSLSIPSSLSPQTVQHQDYAYEHHKFEQEHIIQEDDRSRENSIQSEDDALLGTNHWKQ
ncbi:hypothetical protein G6F46_002713 [Rhizopus delemar]|nr:hypothetical protein G6F55_009784 [Rhizopus delemar]KAG1537014.1 hypothetical protein G6F51_010627 [Rhizopus arrhizus]KAG1491235.1 hypothetical protein G6F54_010164 [Rhizopus delemar]KAG1504812.1 hypothetical protein G6F53_010319 [Rhizopus delemar]KAG1520320.1 hypothetical protein G6F52_007776 [Rhizopus delemar]